MPLSEFWMSYQGSGLHHEDVAAISSDNVLHWGLTDATNNLDAFERSHQLSTRLHAGLLPQPFFGNINAAKVYVLFGNPGVSIQDYRDEFDGAEWRNLCAASLAAQRTDFVPMALEASLTSAHKYWKSTLRSLIRDLSSSVPNLQISEAEERLRNHFAVIEAGAYHSKRFPSDGFSHLPSSQAALRFVQDVVAPRAERGECAIFVWRQARFWNLQQSCWIRIREPKRANGRYLLREERKFLCDMLLQ